VLLAEDETAIALLLASLLEDLDCEVQVVYNGRDAISALMSKPPDLVISDITMPHASGLEVLRALRLQDSNRRTPVILLSAAVSPEVVDEDVRFIPKPFNVEYVLDAVTDALDDCA
jgi:CheY-like chemotaxis protein